MLSLIVAIGRNREIGKDGRMPWPTLSQDFKHLQEKTMGKTLLMGQKTFESLPGVLPKRFHIIVSDDPNFHKEHKRVRVERDLYRVLEECQAKEVSSLVVMAIIQMVDNFQEVLEDKQKSLVRDFIFVMERVMGIEPT